MIADDLTTTGSLGAYCMLGFGDDPGLDVAVWIGFDSTLQSYCQLDNDGTYSLMTDPTTYYVVGDETMYYSDAPTWCSDRGWTLASIHRDAENEAVFALCSALSYAFCWLGMLS